MSNIQQQKNDQHKSNTRIPTESNNQPTKQGTSRASYERTCHQLDQLSGMARFRKR